MPWRFISDFHYQALVCTSAHYQVDYRFGLPIW